MILVDYNPLENPEYVDQVVTALMAESPELHGVLVEREAIRIMLAKSPSIKCLIHVVDHTLLAVVILTLGPLWYAPKRKGARDLLVWVSPPWRNSNLGLRLIKAIEDWAEREGVDDLYLSQSTGISVERTAQLYTRLGYTVSGFISHKRINHVHRS